ncbi:MAG: uncharacterized protein KVP18_004456 [Porospora cf. gigantea A]|uniref:uncharacterized protein n=1 Tax=Porospora cf. gigantea A TaxID=2853593 RepID=UPI003559BAB0|nr:MAG: hypothetical protein KVP18_004456 [Porospora cf. gigantea A]
MKGVFFVGLICRVLVWMGRPGLEYPEVAFLFTRPKSSITSLDRAAFSVKHPPVDRSGSSPYVNGDLSLPPLAYLLVPHDERLLFVFGTAVDLLNAWLLASLIRQVQRHRQGYILSCFTQRDPWHVALGAYWANGFVFGATACYDMHLHHTLVLAVLTTAVSGKNLSRIGAGLGVLLYLESLPALIWIAPCSVLLSLPAVAPTVPVAWNQFAKNSARTVVIAAQAALIVAGLALSSVFVLREVYGVQGSLAQLFLHFAEPCYGSLLSGMTFRPTLSASTYVLQLMFARYTALYWCTLTLIPFLSLGAALVCHSNSPGLILPSVAVLSFMGMHDAGVADVAFVYCIVSLYDGISREIWFDQLYMVSCTGVVLFATVVNLWLAKDTGNANFVFFQFLTIVVPVYLLGLKFEQTVMQRLYYSLEKSS